MSKVLVAYFSASGVTASLAKKLAQEIKADLFEIEPEAPYSEADLDWRNQKSRSSLEMKDPSSRPAIRSKINYISQYELIFIGFPVWWYREPSIIDTFMEAYAFTDQTIVPFATSGGSSIGNSGENMQKLAPNAKVLAGKRLAANMTGQELSKWAAEWL